MLAPPKKSNNNGNSIFKVPSKGILKKSTNFEENKEPNTTQGLGLLKLDKDGFAAEVENATRNIRKSKSISFFDQM